MQITYKDVWELYINKKVIQGSLVLLIKNKDLGIGFTLVKKCHKTITICKEQPQTIDYDASGTVRELIKEGKVVIDFLELATQIIEERNNNYGTS